MPLMNELHRILKKNGVLEVWVPYFKDDNAFEDPTHVRYFGTRSFMYFDPENSPSKIVYKPYFSVRVERIKYHQSPTFRSSLHKASWIIRHPVKSFRTVWLRVTLKAIKESAP